MVLIARSHSSQNNKLFLYLVHQARSSPGDHDPAPDHDDPGDHDPGDYDPGIGGNTL